MIQCGKAHNESIGCSPHNGRMKPAPRPAEAAHPLGKIWLVANLASQTTDTGRVAALEAALQSAGATIAGKSDFPREAAPDAAALDGIDTLVVMGGDGTLGSASAAATLKHSSLTASLAAPKPGSRGSTHSSSHDASAPVLEPVGNSA